MLKTALAIVALLTPASLSAQDGPLIIAHRGASGERPEHTLAAYERAIDQGADYIEPDLVPTKDGVLVARHENELSGTTDVAECPEFADRRTTKTIDGVETIGWFAEDFTLAELRILRARERLPDLRPANTAFDGLYPVPTLTEILALVAAKEVDTGRRIGLYPEIKHPTYFGLLGYDVGSMLLAALDAEGRTGDDAMVFIQSFDLTPLCELRERTETPLVFLAAAEGGPADLPEQSYADLLAERGLVTIKRCADGIGVDTRYVIGSDGQPTGLIARAHAEGLVVHAWTLRRENIFLPPQLRSSADPADPGDLMALFSALKEAGIDGVFTDNPAELARPTNRDQEYKLLDNGDRMFPGVF